MCVCGGGHCLNLIHYKYIPDPNPYPKSNLIPMLILPTNVILDLESQDPAKCPHNNFTTHTHTHAHGMTKMYYNYTFMKFVPAQTPAKEVKLRPDGTVWLIYRIQTIRFYI